MVWFAGLPADMDHRARRFLEARLSDVMASLFAENNLPDVSSQFLV